MPFVKGKSGNPKGKKKGAVYNYNLSPNILRSCKAQFNEIACEEASIWMPKIIKKSLEMAMEGNEKMIFMLWDKYYDPNLANVLGIKLKSKTAAEIDESQQIIIDKISEGEIDHDYGSNLVKTLAIKRDSSVVKDIAAELWELQEERRKRK